MKPCKVTKCSISVFAQLVHLLPKRVLENLARSEKIKAREFSYSSQMYLLMLGQLVHAFSLNELTDISRIHACELARVRGMTATHLNTFSNANRTRNPKVAEQFYWKVRSYLESAAPSFASGRKPGRLSRFRDRNIYAIDSTCIELYATCIDWAEFRKKKSAVKLHMQTNIASMLPELVILDRARPHDCSKMEDLCATMKAGDIVVADRGYQKFTCFQNLSNRGVFFVVRQKSRAKYRTIKVRKTPEGIVSDTEIAPIIRKTMKKYTAPLRRVEAIVEIDGQKRNMVFLTNNLVWSARTIADLYKSRWHVELLFKELKQTLQLQSFYGSNSNAVGWQIWAALTVHLLLRFMKFSSKWKGSFTRFAGIIRAAVWVKRDLLKLLRFYGMEPPEKTRKAGNDMPYLPGFEKSFIKAMG